MSFTRLVSVLSSVKRGGRGLLSSPSPFLLWTGYFATFTLVMTQISSLWLAQQLSCATPSLVLRNFCSLSRCVSMLLNCRCAQLLSHVQLFCNPIGCSPPGSSVHGILQARILEWVATPSSRGSSQPRDRTHSSWISSIAGGFFTAEPLWEVPS